MAVAIRLTRIGTKKRPFYRIVAADSRCAASGKKLEIIGTYDPRNFQIPKTAADRPAKGLVHLKLDRLQFWKDKGAKMSDTVTDILKRHKPVSETTQPVTAEATKKPRAKAAAKKKVA